MLMLSGSTLTWPHDRQCSHPRFSQSCALHSVVYNSCITLCYLCYFFSNVSRSLGSRTLYKVYERMRHR